MDLISQFHTARGLNPGIPIPNTGLFSIPRNPGSASFNPKITKPISYFYSIYIRNSKSIY